MTFEVHVHPGSRRTKGWSERVCEWWEMGVPRPVTQVCFTGCDTRVLFILESPPSVPLPEKFSQQRPLPSSPWGRIPFDGILVGLPDLGLWLVQSDSSLSPVRVDCWIVPHPTSPHTVLPHGCACPWKEALVSHFLLEVALGRRSAL